MKFFVCSSCFPFVHSDEQTGYVHIPVWFSANRILYCMKSLSFVSKFSAVIKKIFLKGFSKDIFREFIEAHKIKGTDESIEEFYKYTRGYYYYTILAVKVILAMKITLNDFMSKFKQSGMSFDAYLGFTYVNLIPDAIKNFFWFLRTIRHGISINALAILGLYDDFSLGYLKANL